MNRMNLKGALVYDLRASLRSMGIFFLVMTLVWMLNLVLAVSLGGESFHFNGFEMASAVYMFVVGIVSIREDLRLFLQNGCGRPTVFVTQLVLGLFAAIVLAALGGLMMELFRLLGSWAFPQLKIVSLYELMGLAEGQNRAAAVLEGMGYIFFQCLPAFLFGMMVSLAYYRMTKLGKVIFSIAAPGVFFVGLPILVGNNPDLASAILAFARDFYNAFQSTLAFVAALSLIAALLFALGSWMLLRRAPVR